MLGFLFSLFINNNFFHNYKIKCTRIHGSIIWNIAADVIIYSSFVISHLYIADTRRITQDNLLTNTDLYKVSF